MKESPVSLKWTDTEEGRLLCISGPWTLQQARPDSEEVFGGLAGLAAGARLELDTQGVSAYDASLVSLLFAVVRKARERGLEVDYRARSQEGVSRLLQLALCVPEDKSRAERERERDFFSRVGEATIEKYDAFLDVMHFVGEAVLSVGRLLRGRAIFRKQDLWTTVQGCGSEALPIVSLISVLIGMIFAFVGKAQLDAFGASIYVADLVAIAMVREMGCVMTAIIMSGRTGAAFAAQIGSMKVNQEVDALVTFGFKPFDFLVLPRMLALILMLPLLTIYSNIVGIVGGLLVSWLSGIPALVYYHQTVARLDLTQMSLGVIKSVAFGIVIAGAGCLRGMQCGNSSTAVGMATTRAVVTSITAIIVIDSLFAVLFTVLDI
ncbi:phospholipid/cholesterol/gamma-HCH transport system permease protein [Haloferula luteola]|uniref:Phospholipid/cholesterol/gamma-HCH transport system permease protein n=1 Tax=Haloferula luteola TaxID=595692 RepID=A0A840V4T7_9BACT|nr:phospholipid/cholesterol/gamma-HCH transport system permease protein [Haloferula luteola]